MTDSKITTVVFTACLALLTGCAGREAPAAPDPIENRQRSAAWGVLPAGTRIAIRTVTPIHADAAPPEQGWPAVIAGNVGNEPAGPVLASGAPARLVVLPGESRTLGLAAVMVEGTWRSVAPVGAARTDGVPLGTLVDAILESSPGVPTARDKAAVAITGQNIRVPGSALLIFELLQPAQVVGVP